MKVEESWRELKMGDFWQKWQAYSLTFRLKFAVFGSFFLFGDDGRMLKRGDSWKIGKPIALLFCQNCFF